MLMPPGGAQAKTADGVISTSNARTAALNGSPGVTNACLFSEIDYYSPGSSSDKSTCSPLAILSNVTRDGLYSPFSKRLM